MSTKADFREAIAAQPVWLQKAADLAGEALTGVTQHWGADETVAVVGMGASTNAGAVFVASLRERGVRAVNLDASSVSRFPPGYQPADHVIIISESGRSPEPIAAMARLGVTPIVVTNDPASPVTAGAGLVVPLGGFVDSGVYTIGYTTTLVALAAVASSFGVQVADPGALAVVAETALQDFASAAPALAEALDERWFLDIAGQGPSAGSAQAAALLFREAPGLATSPFETLQYLHGPMESSGPHSATMLFGDGRENGVAAQLRDAGALVIQLVTHPGGTPGAYHLSKAADGYAGAVAEIVFAQLIAAELAARRGVKVGDFRFPQKDTKLP
ncbi:MAG: hypothetical protein FWD63_05915 [Propionibacteriaceae bacterium]|nr:hypothetical protein [Propionibacteriaceae bacterium]